MNVTLTLSYQLWLPGERLQGQLVLPPNWGGGVLYCLRGCALPHQQPHTTALSQTHGLRPLVSERSFLFELRGERSSSRNREKRWVGERRGLCVDEWVQKIENKLWQYKYVVVSKTVVTVTHQVRTIATTVTVADAITDNVNARSAKIVRSGVRCTLLKSQIQSQQFQVGRPVKVLERQNSKRENIELVTGNKGQKRMRSFIKPALKLLLCPEVLQL